MKLLAYGRPRPDVDASTAIAPHARAELQARWRMYADGFVREMYSPGGPGAILIVEAATTQDAAATVAGPPLAANDIIEFELTELRPFSALAMLFVDHPPSR